MSDQDLRTLLRLLRGGVEHGRGDVCVRGQSGLGVAVVFDVDGAALEGAAVAVIVFDVMSAVQ